jgi:hypothetical protein
MKTDHQEVIRNLRFNGQWNKILDLIIIENLNELWFQVSQAEALVNVSRKKEAHIVIENIFKIANKEDPKDMLLLGKTFEILEDLSNCILWYTKAAEFNEPNSQFNLGYFYDVNIFEN